MVPVPPASRPLAELSREQRRRLRLQGEAAGLRQRAEQLRTQAAELDERADRLEQSGADGGDRP